MGNGGTKENQNVYFRARKQAAMYNERLSSREGAAEMLGISPSTLADYELGIPAKTEADCSSLVRACCIQAGFDPGNFNTSAEVSALKASKRFMEPITVKSGTKLCNGDILVTKTKGHTVVVISGNPRQAVSHYPKYKGASGSIVTALAAVGEKDTSKAHRAKIAAANGIKNYAYTAAQNLEMVNLLKKGKLIKA